eukprot:m.98641 g.98641  ORF g.98641 m.98641 type:complete len:89 (-) comp9018_c0_seq1:3779-4045(-)
MDRDNDADDEVSEILNSSFHIYKIAVDDNDTDVVDDFDDDVDGDEEDNNDECMHLMKGEPHIAVQSLSVLEVSTRSQRHWIGFIQREI